MNKEVKKYFEMNHKMEILKNEDGSFFGSIKEFSGCMTEGDTIEEVYKMLNEAKELWIETVLEDRGTILIPETEIENNYSGKILVRLPKFLHKKIAETAKFENVSINQYIVSKLAGSNKQDNLLNFWKEFLQMNITSFSEEQNMEFDNIIPFQKTKQNVNWSIESCK